VIAAIAGATSCDRTERAQAAGGVATTPLATAQRFIAAVNASDAAALEPTLTERAREELRAGMISAISGEPISEVVWGAPVVEGKIARVPFRATRAGETHDATIHERRERGEWRIHALEVARPGSGSMKLDLETVGAFAGRMASSLATEPSGTGASGPESQAGGAAEAVATRMAQELADGIARAFEEAQRESETRELARRRADFEALKAVSRESFTASWKLDRDLRGVAAATAIETLAAELGLSVDFGGERARLSAPVTRDVRGHSRAFAIEAIAADLGCHPVFPPVHELEALGDGALARALGAALGGGPGAGSDAAALAAGRSAAIPGAIRFEAGPPAPMFAHSGPFRISVDSVEQDSRYATGSVEVVTRAYGLDPALAAALAAVDEAVSFEAVRDDQGRDLRVETDVRYLGGGRLVRGACEDRTTIELKGLLRDVPRIARISGTQRLVLPRGVVPIELSPLAAGHSGKDGKLRYAVREAGESTTVVFSGPEEMIAALMVVGRARDAAGMELAIQHESTTSWSGGEAQYQIHCSIAPARLDLKCITGREVVEFPFAIEGIALPRAHEAPAEIPRLSFAGHGAPVEARFVEIRAGQPGFPQVVLALSNHSNKDAETITARFEYLSAAGALLEDFPHTLSAPVTFDGRSPLLASRRSAEHETTAFFMPENTATVRVTVDSVEFMDATKWHRDGSR
jgi:hypothetical protein